MRPDVFIGHPADDDNVRSDDDDRLGRSQCDVGFERQLVDSSPCHHWHIDRGVRVLQSAGRWRSLRLYRYGQCFMFSRRAVGSGGFTLVVPIEGGVVGLVECDPGPATGTYSRVVEVSGPGAVSTWSATYSASRPAQGNPSLT